MIAIVWENSRIRRDFNGTKVLTQDPYNNGKRLVGRNKNYDRASEPITQRFEESDVLWWCNSACSGKWCMKNCPKSRRPSGILFDCRASYISQLFMSDVLAEKIAV